MKKCVIIGSGLGGLSCGVILAKNGYDVTVLEQGSQAGGCLQCFRRNGIVFETGMHYIGSADPGQTLHTILQYLEVDKDVTLSRLNPMGYDVISFEGEHYSFANGKDNFINTLAQHFPKSRDDLARYYDLVNAVSASAPLHSLNRDADMSIYAEYDRKSVSDVIDSIISDPLLRQVLVGILPLYAGVRGQTPFTTHALISDFYNQSAFRIVGGSSAIADSLVATIRKRGGRVLVRHKVQHIECNDTHATAVITADGQRFPADLIVSAIHPANTVGLVESHLLRPAYRKRLQRAQNTISPFTVYLKFRKDTVPYLNSNLFFYRGHTIWGCEDYDDKSWPKFLLYMHFCHELHPKYAESGQVITYMRFDEVQQWQGTAIGHRGQEYEDFKRRKAEAVIEALEQEFPGISGSIESYYTSTPLTYQDYTGVPQGSMYGIAKDVNVFAAGSISYHTNIPNLLLAGQCITLHGMLGVLAGSLMACSEKWRT